MMVLSQNTPTQIHIAFAGEPYNLRQEVLLFIIIQANMQLH
jgi:hypothetical protein